MFNKIGKYTEIIKPLQFKNYRELLKYYSQSNTHQKYFFTKLLSEFQKLGPDDTRNPFCIRFIKGDFWLRTNDLIYIDNIKMPVMNYFLPKIFEYFKIQNNAGEIIIIKNMADLNSEIFKIIGIHTKDAPNSKKATNQLNNLLAEYSRTPEKQKEFFIKLQKELKKFGPEDTRNPFSKCFSKRNFWLRTNDIDIYIDAVKMPRMQTLLPIIFKYFQIRDNKNEIIFITGISDLTPEVFEIMNFDNYIDN